MKLKTYQEHVLYALRKYCETCNIMGADEAFLSCTGRQYIGVRALPGLPYVCLKVPTGGGKTFIAAHAISIVRDKYLRKDMSVVLWLVPTNQIKEQTLDALKDPNHPYRLKIEEKNGGNVQVWDLHDALYANKSFYENSTCIIVSTLAALRIDDINGRKIYESNGNLMNHFTGLNSEQLNALEKGNAGEILYSLANVLRLRRPIVIMDEAHNARTPLSFETLSRFNPSAIIEFTATPQQIHNPSKELYASNVLYAVSAAELQTEDMIKMPLFLETNTDWEEILKKAITKRNILEKVALKENNETGEYIRPILLIQAQSKSQERETLTVGYIKNYLLKLKIPENHIKIQTGDIKELNGENLFLEKSKTRYIITVQALKEGWDCSFAYVLASIVDVGSATASEQLVGRILRLPQAERKNHQELNCSYAYVVSNQFHETLESLGNSLIENGYTEFDAKKNIIEGHTDSQISLYDFLIETKKKVKTKPDFSNLPEHLYDKVEFNDKSKEVCIVGTISKDDLSLLKQCFEDDEDKKAVESIYDDIQKKLGEEISVEPILPRTKQSFVIPYLSYLSNEQLSIFDETHFSSYKWNISEYDARLDAKHIMSFGETRFGKIDVNKKGNIELEFINDLQEQLTFLGDNSEWSVEELIYWLDRNIIHFDIAQAKFVSFIFNTIQDLINNQDMSLNKLVQFKYSLRDDLTNLIKKYRLLARKEAYQIVFNSDSLVVSESNAFEFDKERYPANSYYDGRFKFKKHYYPNVGELKSVGEEFECAVFIDSLPEVECWIRNLERQPQYSFWLQTSTDKFYPDFVVNLTDGRMFVIEYKGAYLANKDTDEKNLLGNLWARKSKGRCLYLTAFKETMKEDILRLIRE